MRINEWANECTLTCTIISVFPSFIFFTIPYSLTYLNTIQPFLHRPFVNISSVKHYSHSQITPYIHVSHCQRWFFIFLNNIIELPTIFSKFFFYFFYFLFFPFASFSHLASFVFFSDLLRVVLTQKKEEEKKESSICILFWMPLKLKKWNPNFSARRFGKYKKKTGGFWIPR